MRAVWELVLVGKRRKLYFKLCALLITHIIHAIYVVNIAFYKKVRWPHSLLKAINNNEIMKPPLSDSLHVICIMLCLRCALAIYYKPSKRHQSIQGYFKVILFFISVHLHFPPQRLDWLGKYARNRENVHLSVKKVINAHYSLKKFITLSNDIQMKGIIFSVNMKRRSNKCADATMAWLESLYFRLSSMLKSQHVSSVAETSTEIWWVMLWSQDLMEYLTLPKKSCRATLMSMLALQVL